ncbi:hypothetical protein R5R35_006186 [Gryllus longicercus]|uniref:Tyrosine-protein phosphatase non-receptor type 23 n=1 Tax=Gryllus longicercus TaxID=2509291 RepID=A0AAN9Z3Y0_9ORTH
MEAVPRLPMLSFDLKVSPERTTFGQKLKQYIRDFYHEDPEMYSNEIHALEGLRASAVCAVRDVTGCSTLKRYYCQLHFLQSRFPMHRDGAAAVSFTWRDTYASMVCTLSDIRFEMVAILYNIGALHSQLGASDSRTTSDGMKMSCTHFQCAAWAFQHLKDSFPQPAGVDLAPDVMQFMYHLSLAQAQECILEKSMMDNRKATIIAKVAAQIVDYYNLALNTLEQGGSDDCSVSETVGSKIYKTWKRYVKFKTAYHSCVALLYQGQQAEEQQKMGERVAYYQAASEKLEEASKLAKGMDYADVISEALTFTADVVEGKKKAAKNENEFIYHEEVPERDALTDIKGASLVKGIAFNVNDPEISGPDIFARLVPMKAHEASSLYSEEKAKLLRRVGAQIDEKDEELVSFMTSLQLEHLNIHGESSRLPQELIDRCAALSVKPNAIQNLIDSMNKLSDTYQDVEAMLQEIKDLLQEEEIQEKKYQEVVGKRPPSIVATDLTREAGKYQEAHGKASESNQTLHKAMMLHVSNLRVLAQPLAELQKSVPEVSPPSTSDDQEAVEKLRQLVAKVEEMRRQRAMLSAQLRESICQDDITRQLVTRASEPLDAIFNQELQKHQRYVSLVEQNLAAQDNILRALTDAYARYGSTRKATNEAVRKREATISALIASYDAYEDLLAKSSKGLEFYRKLEVNVSKLLQRVRSACKVQEEEREQVLAKALPAASKAAVAAAAVPGSASPVAGSSSGVAIGSGESMSVDSSSTSSGGPKLRDYLQSMKRGSSVTAAAAAAVGGYGAGTQPVATVADMPMYYPADYVHPVAGITAGTVPSTSTAVSSSSGQSPYYDQVSTVTSSHSQWALPPVRPAPVGSEGPDVSQTEPSAKAPPTVPAISDTDKSSAVTGPTQYPYQPDVSARITSGGYPPGYLAGAAYGNASGAYPTPPQPQYKPVIPTYQQYGSYMPPTSAAYDTGASVSSAATNPAYMYTGTYQNQATSVAQSLPQTSYAPTGAAASAAYPTGTYQATNMNLSIQSGEVPSLSGYPSVSTGLTATNPSNIGTSKPYKSTYDRLFASQEPQASQQPQATPATATGASNYIQGTMSYDGQWSQQQQYQQAYQMYSQYQQYPSQSQHPQSQQQQQQQLHQQQQQPAQQQPQPQTQQQNQSQQSQQPQLPQQPLQSQPAQSQQTVPQQYTQQQQPYTLQQNSQLYSQQQQQQLTPQQQQQQLTSQQQLQYLQKQLPQQSQYSQQPQTQFQQYSHQGSQFQQDGQKPNKSDNTHPHQPSSQDQGQQGIRGSGDNQWQRQQPQQLQQPQQPQQSQHPSQNSPSRYIPASAYSAYPYVAAASASYYTNAGSYPTSQTCSSQTGIEGQTFAAQYNTTYAVPSGYPTSNAYSPSAYYTLPYGYQSLDSPAAQVAPAPVDPQNMTYMQACGGKQTTTTTYMYPNASGQSTASSEPTTATSSVNSVPTPTAVTTTAPTFSKSSNVDLLAGLDFSLNQAPLTPQQLPVSKVSESAISNAASAPTPVSVVTTSTTTSVSVSTPAPIVVPNVPLSADTVPVIEPGVIKSPVGPTKTGAVSGDADNLVENEGQEGCRGAECRLSKVSGKDPYSDPELLNQFVQDVEKFEKFVEGLTSKTLNGPTPLDIKWKELLDLQEKDAHKRSISVARCYPMKNRFPDILPYDNSRVELPSTKDDYINASFVKDVTPLTPPFILTQAPLPSTISDFWTMVMEQQVEVVVCLLSDAELSGQVYWPVDKSQEMVSGRLRLTLQSCNTRAHWVERILSITCGDTRVTRVIVHLQFTGWPGSSFPSSPGPFLALVLEVLSLHRQQRVGWHPLVVHCLSGVGRSGLLCVLAAALLEVQAGRGLADLVTVAAAASSHRKNCLRDRQHLQFAYQALLYHAQDLLMKRGILTSRSSFEDKRNRGTKCHTRHPSEDFLLGAPADLNSKPQNSSEEVEPEPQPPGSSSVEKPTNASDPLSKLDPLWSLRQS